MRESEGRQREGVRKGREWIVREGRECGARERGL